jgi:hypothetical protein
MVPMRTLDGIPLTTERLIWTGTRTVVWLNEYDVQGTKSSALLITRVALARGAARERALKEQTHKDLR